MDVRIAPRVVAEGLHHHDHARLERRRRRGLGHQLPHGLVGRTAQPPEQRPVVEEVRPEHLREREHPLGVANLFEHLLAQEGGELGGTLGSAGRAQAAALAREAHQVLGSARTAAHPGKAVLQHTAVEVAADGLVQECPPEAVPPLEALLPLVAHVVVDRLDGAVERRRAGLARAVKGTGWKGHETARCRGADE
jgi:hypothetical protein